MRLLLAIVVLALASSARAFDLPRMIETIRMVENSATTGRAGERSPWQILPSVWRQYSTKPLSWASGRRPEHLAEQLRVVNAHLDWIRAQLSSAGLDANSPYNIALVWGAGWETVRKGRTSEAKRDYAGRAQNIYDSLR